MATTRRTAPAARMSLSTYRTRALVRWEVWVQGTVGEGSVLLMMVEERGWGTLKTCIESPGNDRWWSALLAECPILKNSLSRMIAEIWIYGKFRRSRFDTNSRWVSLWFDWLRVRDIEEILRGAKLSNVFTFATMVVADSRQMHQCIGMWVNSVSLSYWISDKEIYLHRPRKTPLSNALAECDGKMQLRMVFLSRLPSSR